MLVIHNISIATDDDIIRFCDDVIIYPVNLSKAIMIIIILGNCLNWLEVSRDHCFRPFFVNFL